MKVSELKYERVTLEEITEAMNRITPQVKNAKTVEEVLEAREQYVKLGKRFETAFALSYMRYTINTVDEFYVAEKDYYDEILPQVQNLMLSYSNALLDSPFRPELEKRLIPVIFKKLEIERKAMDPIIVEDMIEENKIVSEYSKLMAGIMVEFRGEKRPRALHTKFLNDDDRNTRREAYDAMGAALEEHAEELDDIYDRLVKVRDRMAKKMGYKNYVELGYYNMGRICYDKDMVEKFRNNVVNDVVPVVSRLKLENAKKLGIDNFMLYDDGISIPGGNPKPIGDKDYIFNATKEMYHAMSEETGKFIDMMMENEAFDVVARENKWGGGYCIDFPEYSQPFILANFNGTSDDVDVMTHEAGHAFAAYMAGRNKFTFEAGLGMETAETHSMSMEFFAWKYIDKFFGENTEKYKFMHAFSALAFLPYGCMVDEFQHIVYENPEMTPAERKEAWNKLDAKYRPYLSTKGMRFLEQGTRWQYQMHIYETPFYYIDYCLAQVLAFEFLLESQKDYDDAFERYVGFLSCGGEKFFTDLIKDAGLKSPFDDGALSEVARETEKLLKSIKID